MDEEWDLTTAVTYRMAYGRARDRIEAAGISMGSGQAFARGGGTRDAGRLVEEIARELSEAEVDLIREAVEDVLAGSRPWWGGGGRAGGRAEPAGVGGGGGGGALRRGG